ncbi:MAG: sodium:proton antiporter, partial [Pseudomonadota bacterium]
PMTENIILAVTLIGLLGVGAQWLAWRLNLPAIVLMAIAGILIGPIAGVLHPEDTFGEFYRPMISIAVAVILFEGGLQLKFSELRGLTRGIGRIVLVGGPLSWVFGALAGYYIGGFSWPTAIIFAGIMIVTGPTVIMPLLRQAKLSSRPSALLKWEGIINDPIGALAAVIAFEFFHVRANPGLDNFEMFGSLFVGSVLCTLWGIGIGYNLARAFRTGAVPEYLKSPLLLVAVLIAFGFANFLQEEGGLLAVTAMGVTMANTKMPSINQLRHFKENIAVMLIAGVFVMLTANLSFDVLGQLDWRAMAFIAAMLFVVRPAAIMLSTQGTNLSFSERLLVSWIAPRGIVAVAVSGLFAASLHVEDGFTDGELMVPLAFAMVFATVLLHGFTIAPLGRMLGLASTLPPGVLISGASPWSTELAKKIQELDVPVLITDPSYRRLRDARQAGIETYRGEILSEVTEHHVDFVRFGSLLALSGNEAHNALVCTDLAPEMDRAKVYQLYSGGADATRSSVSQALQGRTLLSSHTSLEDLLRLHWRGYRFQFTRLTEEYTPDIYLKALPESAMIVMVSRKGVLLFQTEEAPLSLAVGDRVLSYVPPESAQRASKASDEEAPSAALAALEEQKKAAIDRVTP